MRPAELAASLARRGDGEGNRGDPMFIGGNTACVSVEIGETFMILDAGSGLRSLGQEMMRGPWGVGRGRASLFLSHTHWDHIQGFPFFAPAFGKGNVLHVYGGHPDLRQRLAQQQRPEFFPVPLEAMAGTLRFHRLLPGQAAEIGRARVRLLALPHPGISYAYRIETAGTALVYATDGEYTHRFEDDDAEAPHLYGLDVEDYVTFFRGADVLVFDAMFALHDSIAKADWGHSTALVGVDLAVRAGVRNLVLFHHDHLASDDDIWGVGTEARRAVAVDPRKPSLQVQVAYEGLDMMI
jgi:phosphoribosyl 1,2-cyclic phosphodiesterase